MPVPTYDNLFNPLLKVLHQLGGSGSNPETEERVAETLNLTEKEINEPHRWGRTKLNYNLAWARTYLKLYGIIENSARGVWALTKRGKGIKKVDKEHVKKYVNRLFNSKAGQLEKVIKRKEIIKGERMWQDKLMENILQLSPDSFEKMCQRILRESGFINVEVTGRSGDGGIDGKGIVRLGGFLNFHVVFQCKRYKGTISTDKIRDFRGAMMGKGDKGLFITTGNFTREAKKEATRDGALPIDLIDGEELIEKMRELGLGIKLKTEEVIEINKEWFEDF